MNSSELRIFFFSPNCPLTKTFFIIDKKGDDDPPPPPAPGGGSAQAV